MSKHPPDGAVRFLIKPAALAASGVWRWRLEICWPRFVSAFALPVAAAAWGTFAVPDDSSWSDEAPVPGIVRLGLELVILSGAARSPSSSWQTPCSLYIWFSSYYVLGGALVMLRWPRLVWADVPTIAVRCHDIKTPPGPDAQDLNDLMVA